MVLLSNLSGGANGSTVLEGQSATAAAALALARARSNALSRQSFRTEQQNTSMLLAGPTTATSWFHSRDYEGGKRETGEEEEAEWKTQLAAITRYTHTHTHLLYTATKESPYQYYH